MGTSTEKVAGPVRKNNVIIIADFLYCASVLLINFSAKKLTAPKVMIKMPIR
jgi:hypothetical protein